MTLCIARRQRRYFVTKTVAYVSDARKRDQFLTRLNTQYGVCLLSNICFVLHNRIMMSALHVSVIYCTYCFGHVMFLCEADLLLCTVQHSWCCCQFSVLSPDEVSTVKQTMFIRSPTATLRLHACAVFQLVIFINILFEDRTRVINYVYICCFKYVEVNIFIIDRYSNSCRQSSIAFLLN